VRDRRRADRRRYFWFADWVARVKESQIESYFVDRVRVAGGIQRKFVSPGRKGVPDRIVGFPVERFALVELKATGGKPRDDQVREHKRWRKLGFCVVVINSLQHVDSFIEFMTRP